MRAFAVALAAAACARAPGAGASPGAAPAGAPAGTLRLAFGSCSQASRAQPFWPAIAARGPDAFVWLGDIVYADAPIFAKWRRPAALADVAAQYAAQAARPDYAAFLARGGRGGGAPLVTGIWDDHDLGVNDADARVPAAFTNASAALLLDFLREPPASARRARGAGVYGAWDLEAPAGGGPARLVPEGGARDAAAALRVRLVLLDVRAFRAPWGGASHDVLGAAQWAWLERALVEGAAAGAHATLIGSGIQVLAPGDPPVTEEWDRAPGALARLVALLAATRTRGAVLLSGDVHFGELNVARGAKRLLGYELWEATSSGLTHSWGGLIKATTAAALLWGTTRAALPAAPPWAPGGAAPEPRSFCASDVPWRAAAAAAARALGRAAPEGREGGLCFYAGLNWGEVDVSADAVRVRVWGEGGAARLAHELPLAALQPPAEGAGEGEGEGAGAGGDAALRAAAAACARADLAAGMPPPCAAVYAALMPRATRGAAARHAAAHAAVAAAALAAAAAAVALPVAAARALEAAPRFAPGAPPLLARAAAAAAIAALARVLVWPPCAFVADALMT